jgi:hypothetical protein
MSRIPKQAVTPLIIFIIAASLAQGTQRHFVSYMAIKKEKEVTLNPLLPDVCDSYLLICGRPATYQHIKVSQPVPESNHLPYPI